MLITDYVMHSILNRLLIVALAITLLSSSDSTNFIAAAEPIAAAKALPPINHRFADADIDETPDFQRHVVPLFGRLGCNARACHGSFQGQGGFQLSLFGYDFKFDHQALLDKESPRVNSEKPLKSLIIDKPTDEDNHEGGQRYAKDSWEYNVIRKWIEAGAQFEKTQELSTVEITPREILFTKPGETFQLQAVAIWADGTREDVTTLCRFRSNDDQVCKIDENGLITGNDAGDTHVVISYDKAVVPVPVMRPFSDKTGDKFPAVETKTKIDELVVTKLRKLGIVPSETCSDEEFLRRVQLDLTGSLPTADQVRKFLADKSTGKRAAKIDELLESPPYAAWWATKLCDFTGNNDQQLQNVLPPMPNGDKKYKARGNVASQAWFDWIRKRVQDNVSYDEIVEGIVTSQSVEPGQSYKEYCEEMCSIYRGDNDKSFADMSTMPYYWARRDFKQVEPRVISFAHAFMGIRIQCAQCHKHPFDQWSKEDFAEFSGFFKNAQMTNNRVPAEYKSEYDKIVDSLNVNKKLKGNMFRKAVTAKLKEGKVIPFNILYVTEPTSPQMRKGAQKKNKNKQKKNAKEQNQVAKLLGGEKIDLGKQADPRESLMTWLRDRDNPYFAKAFVNRVWAAYFSRGIVDSPDDMSLANPPVNAELLDWLASNFYEKQFDMKWLHRTILNSDTYQRSFKSNETNAGDLKNFSHAVPRRLPAEVVYDAIVSATASDDARNKLLENMNGRAIAIPGSNGQNRNSAGEAGFALTVFGRSTRESNCDCDRTMDPSLLQTVFLQNDQQIHSLINSKTGWIKQLETKYQLEKQNAPQVVRPDNYDRRVEIMQKEIKRLKARGDEKSKKRSAAARKRLTDFEKKYAIKKSDPNQKKAAKFDANVVIEDAYLRTLSRFPSESETERCRQYITDADDPIAGTRDVLWALINTKEFIVNK